MNVIWVVSDTLRRDHIGAYGNQTIHTPSLDAFADTSIRFDRHYIAGFPTMPTRADHLTGRWTMSFMQWEPFAKDVVTLPQILSAKGIQTTGVVDTPFFIQGEMNYDRGFRTFHEINGQLLNLRGDVDFTMERRYDNDYFAPRTFSKAMEWLEYHYKENFFLYIDTWDPHEPWDPPKYYVERYWPDYDGDIPTPPYGYWQETPGITEEGLRKAHAAYCGEVTMVDTWFGYLMRKVENLGLLENTAIIFTSDHGYYFGEHNGLFGKMVLAKDPETGEEIMGVWGHSLFYNEVTDIPLLSYVPNVEPGSYKGLTSAVDLMPTVLDIMGQEIPSFVEGKSLLPMMKDPSKPGRKYVASANPYVNAGDTVKLVDDMERVTANDATTTITTDEWSLLYTTEPGRSELYNLKTDPRQENNVISQYPDKAKELHKLLVEFLKETKVPDRILERRLKLLL